MRITKHCETCGSEAVRVDAYAEWDFDSQSWELAELYDYSWCCDCDAGTNIIDKEVKETSA
jgi:hypothetical protein